MKTTEQINLAKEMYQKLQDYVELARVEKKLKIEQHRLNVNEELKLIAQFVENNSENL